MRRIPSWFSESPLSGGLLGRKTFFPQKIPTMPERREALVKMTRPPTADASNGQTLAGQPLIRVVDPASSDGIPSGR